MAALPYMQLYVAEYLADTLHLTAAQHGGYMLLLMNYWQRGKALPNNDARLMVTARMSAKEWAANREAIAEFFTITETEWIHNRVDRDLEEVQSKSDTNKANGKLGGRPKKPNGYANGLPNGSKNETESKGNRTEQIRTDNPPLPPEGKNRPLSEPLEPSMVARGIIDDLRISGNDILTALTDVCRLDMNAGVSPEYLRETLTARHREYTAARPRLQITWGTAKFFGEGHWRDPALWPWREGMNPEPPKPKRIYINGNGGDAA